MYIKKHCLSAIILYYNRTRSFRVLPLSDGPPGFQNPRNKAFLDDFLKLSALKALQYFGKLSKMA